MELVSLLTIAIGTFLAFSLAIVGLLEAPWPVLCGGMLLTLLGLQRLSGSGQVPEEDVFLEKETQPKLGNGSELKNHQPADEGMTYRGIHYNPPNGQSIGSETRCIEGTYRGQPWQRSVPISLAAKQSEPEITYRGHKVRKPKPEEKNPS
ncbi:MAG TPA: DUF4278 domain-containing protein [Leptolyngbyaceae cyanobacterium]